MLSQKDPTFIKNSKMESGFFSIMIHLVAEVPRIAFNLLLLSAYYGQFECTVSSLPTKIPLKSVRSFEYIEIVLKDEVMGVLVFIN